MTEILTNAQTPIGGVFVLSALILLGFIVIFPKITKDSPFAPHALSIVGVMLILPAIMFLGVTKTIDANAISAVIGAITAYIFASKKE